MKKAFFTLICCIFGFSYVLEIGADDDHRYNYGTPSFQQQKVQYDQYVEECSQCHLAYPPNLLPEESWKKILSQMPIHFSEEFELDPKTQAEILSYLVKNAAESSNQKLSKKILRSIPTSSSPERITSVSYIKRKHREIPKRLIENNEKIESMSHCNACHKQAEQSYFDDDSVSIPGYGKWDD